MHGMVLSRLRLISVPSPRFLSVKWVDTYLAFCKTQPIVRTWKQTSFKKKPRMQARTFSPRRKKSSPNSKRPPRIGRDEQRKPAERRLEQPTSMYTRIRGQLSLRLQPRRWRWDSCSVALATEPPICSVRYSSTAGRSGRERPCGTSRVRDSGVGCQPPRNSVTSSGIISSSHRFEQFDSGRADSEVLSGVRPYCNRAPHGVA